MNPRSRLKILIAAGGSGGHIFPAVALAKRLKDRERNVDIKFVGSNRYLDKKILKKENFDFFLLSANKLPYKFTPRMALFFAKSVFDVIKAFIIMISYRPSCVVGFGGYVSWPVIFASYILRVPRIVHEQNVMPGRANKILFKMADTIAISFDETLEYIEKKDKEKAVFTGNPIRHEELKIDKISALKQLGLDPGRFTILVIGGSQGAHILNRTFVKAMSGLDRKTRDALQVIHITGSSDHEWVVKAYEALELEHRAYSFVDRMDEVYGASDLIAARSGASCIFEIAYLGKAMILVPYPFARAHQVENARAFSKKGAAIEVEEAGLSPEIFKDKILTLLNDSRRLHELGARARALSVPRASDNLADEVLKFALGRS